MKITRPSSVRARSPRIRSSATTGIHRVWACAAAAALAAFVSGCAPPNDDSGAIVIERQGAFAVGGRVLGDARASLHCDHGVVEYQIPPDARAVSLLMWHSASAVAWQTR